MTEHISNSKQTVLTRRKAIHLLSAAAGGSLLLSAAGCKHEATGSKQAKVKSLDCTTGTSVFCTNCGKYGVKDYPDTDFMSGVYALWLMVTTEEWDPCLTDQPWYSLSGELNLAPKYLTWLYGRSHDPSPVNGQTYTPLQLFAQLRNVWKTFRTTILQKTTYYPGYGTLLRIAGDFPQAPPKTALPEQCGIAGPAITTGPLRLGPLAFWLMLITEDWSGCFAVANWVSGLASEMNTQVSYLNYLIGKNQDTTPITSPTGTPLPYSNSDAFAQARFIFDDFVHFVGVTNYGARPCPGGPTLLRIARGGM